MSNRENGCRRQPNSVTDTLGKDVFLGPVHSPNVTHHIKTYRQLYASFQNLVKYGILIVCIGKNTKHQATSQLTQIILLIVFCLKLVMK